MKKRLMVGLLSAGLVVGMVPGVVSAAPNADSAAGACGLANDTNLGLGDSIGQDFIPGMMGEAEYLEMSLGEALSTFFAESGPAFGVPEYCAPGGRVE